jgi:hypothetical protein
MEDLSLRLTAAALHVAANPEKVSTLAFQRRF